MLPILANNTASSTNRIAFGMQKVPSNRSVQIWANVAAERLNALGGESFKRAICRGEEHAMNIISKPVGENGVNLKVEVLGKYLGLDKKDDFRVVGIYDVGDGFITHQENEADVQLEKVSTEFANELNKTTLDVIKLGVFGNVTRR
jgi:hypothetical protein